jgi:hypothetical protein
LRGIDLSQEEVVRTKPVFVNRLENNQVKVYNANNINILSKKIIEQYGNRIAEKDALISSLRNNGESYKDFQQIESLCSSLYQVPVFLGTSLVIQRLSTTHDF